MTDEEFTDLYRRLSGHVLRFAMKRLECREQALEVVSDTFEVAWNKRESFSSNPAERAGFIFGIARNKIAQEHGRAKRKHHDNRFVADFPRAEERNSTPDVADQVIEVDSARRVLHGLSDDDQELIALAFVVGLNAHDAASMLGITVTAYTSRVSRLNQHIALLTEADSAHSTQHRTGSA